MLPLFQLEMYVYHMYNGICICVMQAWTHCCIQALSALMGAFSQVFPYDVFKNLYCFSITSLYIESNAFLLYVKFSGGFLILHSVKDAVVNIYCNFTIFSLSLMARDNRLVFSEMAAVASGFVNYSALKLTMLIFCFCYFISL